MKPWRLQGVLRLRREAEARASLAHAAAVTLRRAREAALADALSEGGGATFETCAPTVATLLVHERHRRQRAQRAAEARRLLGDALRGEESARATRVAARREAHALEALREREERRERGARERAEEEELLDAAMARASARRA